MQPVGGAHGVLPAVGTHKAFSGLVTGATPDEYAGGLHPLHLPTVAIEPAERVPPPFRSRASFAVPLSTMPHLLALTVNDPLRNMDEVPLSTPAPLFPPPCPTFPLEFKT